MSGQVIGDCEVHDVASAAVGDTFRVFVGHCHPPDATDLPVVYVTDANGAFGMTVDLVRHLQLGGHLPHLLVVGIGYPVSLLRDTLAVRCRDLTPTTTDEMRGAGGIVLPSGGASSFLAFVADELQPWVAERFAAGPSATYAGHSLGGLFGAYVLLTRPATFGRYALASPSVWWDGKTILDLARRTDARPAPGTAVSIVVGGEETPEGRRLEQSQLGAPRRSPTTTGPQDMVGDAGALAAVLGARWPDLDVRCRALVDEHHVTIPPIALSYGLRALFGAPGGDRLVPRATSG